MFELFNSAQNLLCTILITLVIKIIMILNMKNLQKYISGIIISIMIYLNLHRECVHSLKRVLECVVK